MCGEFGEMRDKPTKDRIILEGYRGSISHGVYVKDWIDDKDIMGIFVPPKECIIGLTEWEHHESKENEYDYVYYNLRKFIRLALKGNPNILCLLWLADEMYTIRTELGNELVKNRDFFTGKHVYHSFTGYAYGQLRRMTHFKFEGYMGEKRKALVEKFGYDCKNASHLIRLLKMGIEFLNEGKLYVLREDNQQLLAIKLGEWSLEQVQKEAEKLFSLAQECYVRSKLPESPKKKESEQLLISLTEKFWKNKQLAG